jgi:hypothetical protein
MRNTILILLFIFGKTYCQNDKNFNIYVSLINCKKDYSFFSKSDTLFLKQNDIVLKSVQLKNEFFEFQNLKKGEYTLEYKNVFNQRNETKIQLNDDNLSLELCIEKFIDTNSKTLLEDLTSNDTLELSIFSSGCFHFEKEKLKFYYKKNRVIVEYYFNNKRKRSITLGKNDLNSFILFERMLILKKAEENNSYCTSSSTYNITVNGLEKFNFLDISCSWEGFYFIKDIFKF